MAVLDSTALQPDFIKLRWLEPYTSGGLNRKTFKSLPRGVYSGFVVKPGPASFEVQINHTDPEGFGEVSGFSAGAFDPASSGWSVRAWKTGCLHSVEGRGSEGKTSVDCGSLVGTREGRTGRRP